MSDSHTGPTHDLPDCPPVRVVASLDRRRWQWFHHCPWHGHFIAQGGYRTWELAYRAADQHARSCEVL